MMYTIGPWAAGLVVRSRRHLAEQLAARSRELEAERDLFAAEAVRYERARIARELHDIVAHCVSVMVIQASAGKRLTTDPARAAEAFDAIGEAARQADAEIGRLAGLLEPGPPRDGGEGMRLLNELISRASAAGLAVTCRYTGSLDDLTSSTCETAYRLVQESLTNALKHAPGAPVAITIHGGSGHVGISVANGRPAAPSGLERAGAGRGLAGMRERVASCGGYLTAGPAPGGGWTVQARLPRQANPVPAGPAG
jgi:signal transduction histidine kinase